ncbi:MAG: (d)CMP kinase [Oscillospiraceae bacterium]|nr:(d)CMP kinase [Oscillospiraceae bacterium]
MNKKNFAIAIDGPAAAGKSSVARRLAAELGFLYVDTGALYRSIGYYAHTKGVATDDAENVVALLPEIKVELKYVDGVQQIWLNGKNVSAEIRLPEMSMAASNVSAMPQVRAFLLDLQRSIAAENSVVMDGRDIATVILPNADIKFFLTASPEARTRRRMLEFEQKGQKVDFDALLAETIQRDYNDSHRAAAPLKQADDAILIDNTDYDFEQTIEKMLAIVKEKL